MSQTELTIKFMTYDGQLSSRPPIFDPPAPSVDVPFPPHELDGRHYELMLIPAGLEKPLSMAFMLFSSITMGNLNGAPSIRPKNFQTSQGWKFTSMRPAISVSHSRSATAGPSGQTSRLISIE